MGMDHLEDLEDGTVANAGPLTQCLTEIARMMGEIQYFAEHKLGKLGTPE